MEAPNERTSLLRRISTTTDSLLGLYQGDRRPSEISSDDENDSDIEDEPVDVLLSRYGSSVGSNLGLSGGVGVFGTSLTRRGSYSFEAPGLNRVPSRTGTLKHRSSYARVNSIDSPNVLSRTSTLTAREATKTRKSVDAGAPGRPDADIDAEEGSVKPPKYLYGVSEPQFWACFISILLVWFVATFDSTLMASSHPVITSYFDASNSASWLSTSFLLTSTAFQPMFARVSDTIGRKTPFLLALFAFGIGTAWCAAAQSIGQFIAARAVCGLGAGGAMALGMIIISDLVPLHRRGSSLAVLNLAYGVGTSLGAALGGFLADTLGWRWEFGVQVPAITLCFAIATVTIPRGLGPCLGKDSKDSFWETLKGFDMAGSFLLTASVAFLILALNLGGNVLPWAHPFVISSFVLSFIMGILLVMVERKAPKPVMPLHLLFQIPRANLIFSNFLACMTMNTLMFNLPLYFQATLLDSPTRSGTRLIIPFLCNMAAAFTAGNLITYTKRMNPTLILGYSLISLGSIFLTFMKRSLPTVAYSWLIATATMGQGFSFPSVSISILAVTHPEDMAVAISTLSLFRSLGAVMGVAASSLASQNALLYYLERMVSGNGRDKIIEDARKSVEAIIHLDPFHREQVIKAYAAALKVTFAQGIVTAVVALLLVLFIRLPKLTSRPADAPFVED